MSREIAQRLSDLKAGPECDVLLVVMTSENRAHERRLHNEWHHSRLPQSEWFNLAPQELEALLADVRAIGPEVSVVQLSNLEQARKAEQRDRKRRWRAEVKTEVQPRRCVVCDTEFTPKRSDAKVCSSKCRTRLSRQKAKA